MHSQAACKEAQDVAYQPLNQDQRFSYWEALDSSPFSPNVKEAKNNSAKNVRTTNILLCFCTSRAFPPIHEDCKILILLEIIRGTLNAMNRVRINHCEPYKLLKTSTNNRLILFFL